MQELIEEFIQNGLTKEQAQASIQAVGQWLEQHYPVAGTMVGSWIKTQTLPTINTSVEFVPREPHLPSNTSA